MFRAKYSRLRFWIVSILLWIILIFMNVFASAMNRVGKFDSAIIFYGISFVIIIIWLNTLANRIRDYGGNPWISLFSLIPFVNIILALYYGISKSKYKEKSKKRDTNSITNAVYNHSKDFVNEIKPAINSYKENHKTSKYNIENIDEDEIYEKVMIEIEEGKKVKSTWAKALVESKGNKDEAESLYIKERVIKIKNDFYVSKEKNKKTIEKQEFLEEQEFKKDEDSEREKSLDLFLKKESLSIIKKINKNEMIVGSPANPLELKIKFDNSTWYIEEILNEANSIEDTSLIEEIQTNESAIKKMQKELDEKNKKRKLPTWLYGILMFFGIIIVFTMVMVIATSIF